MVCRTHWFQRGQAERVLLQVPLQEPGESLEQVQDKVGGEGPQVNHARKETQGPGILEEGRVAHDYS